MFAITCIRALAGAIREFGARTLVDRPPRLRVILGVGGGNLDAQDLVGTKRSEIELMQYR